MGEIEPFNYEDLTDEDIRVIALVGNDFEFKDGTILPSGKRLTDEEIKVAWMIFWLAAQKED